MVEAVHQEVAEVVQEEVVVEVAEEVSIWDHLNKYQNVPPIGKQSKDLCFANVQQVKYLF